MSQPTRVTIFTDGGSRGNPGSAAVGVVALLADKPLFEIAECIGVSTNNEAEYQAFIASVKKLLELQRNNTVAIIEWKLDSLLVVQQLNKKWKIKESRLQKLAQECWRMLDALPYPYTISHVPRSENSAADALVNQALDAA